MTKKLFLIASSVLLVALATHGQSNNRLHFPTTGFSIAPLEAPPGQAPQQVLMMFLPSSEVFAPNVSVTVEAYAGTFSDYVALTTKTFKSSGFKFKRKALGKSMVIFEYTEEIQGRILHSYARTEKSAGTVYVITATANEDQWSAVGAQLKTCVDSFRRDNGDQDAQPVP